MKIFEEMHTRCFFLKGKHTLKKETRAKITHRISVDLLSNTLKAEGGRDGKESTLEEKGKNKEKKSL